MRPLVASVFVTSNCIETLHYWRIDRLLLQASDFFVHQQSPSSAWDLIWPLYTVINQAGAVIGADVTGIALHHRLSGYALFQVRQVEIGYRFKDARARSDDYAQLFTEITAKLSSSEIVSR